MLQSKLITSIRKEKPDVVESKNADLLERGGFIHKQMSGVYAMLPLGLKVTNKIKDIIRAEMNNIGSSEIKMTALQNPDFWKKTDRWDVDVWFKLMTNNDYDAGLGWTHEEPITDMMKHHISSHKDLPKLVYQIQEKFRNEKRAKSGVLRGREFTMKDLYSFSKNEEEHNEIYNKIANAYDKIFHRLNLKAYKTFASGGDFSEFSHEYQVVSDIGEDVIYIDEEKNQAINKEIYNDENCKKAGLGKNLIEKKAVEVGNIFSLSTRFTKPFNVTYKDTDGKENLAVMGSYGIGVERLMGVIVEVNGKDNEIIFPEEIAPYKYHIIALDEETKGKAENLYNNMKTKGEEVLFDDRDNASAGEKFADSDIIGIPNRIIVSKRNDADGVVEFIDRIKEETKQIKYSDL